MQTESEIIRLSNRSSFGRHVVLPLTGLVLGAIALVIAFVLVTARKQDEEARVSSIRLAETAVETKKDAIARNLKDYAFWQDAFDHLHTKVDVQWASTDGNVGANIYNSLGYDLAFVLSPDRHTVYAIQEGKPVEIDAMALMPAISALLPEAAKGGPATVGFMRSGNDIVIAGASAILPSNAADAPPPEARSIMVFVDKMDAELLGKFSHNYLLKDLKLLSGAQPLVAPSASVPLTEPTGAPLGYLTWAPEQPGQAVLHSVIPPLGAVLIALLVFAAIVLRNARRSALELHESADTIRAYALTLETSEARFRDVAEASSDWIWETDADLKLTYVSDRIAEVTHVAAADLLGTTLQEFFSSDTSTDGWSQLRVQVSKKASFRDLRCCYDDKQGSRRICRLAGRPIVNAEGAFLGYRGTAADVTTEVAAQERANHLALHDPLTGLPNRVLLKDRLNVSLEAVRREKTRVAVLCLDLDHFKDVNDTLGHSAGDLLLQQLAHRLQDRVRGMDTVARLGGDEFAIVQVAFDQPADAETLCHRLLEDFKQPFFIEGSELYVGVSIGIAISPDDGTTEDVLLKRADLALYRAKQAGRGTFRFFEEVMDTELQARKALEQELRRALVKDELQLHYQPLVSLDGHELKGVEALLRWSHPARGTVSPGEFIPLAEETGMIVPIGEWVLRTACAQATQWPGLLMAVNVSAVQFKHREFVDTVRQILQETGLEPGRLELEITEGVLLYDTAAALEILTGLKAIGVRIAMDDFGTGYSSLGYLNSFPFDKIKIDRSFITEVAEKDKSGAIVRSVITLGQSLSMVTIAEGVETLEQLDFLRAEGCDQVQGYFFGKPVPPSELTQMLRLKNGGLRLYNYDNASLELLSSTSMSSVLKGQSRLEAVTDALPISTAGMIPDSALQASPVGAVRAGELQVLDAEESIQSQHTDRSPKGSLVKAAHRRELRRGIAFAHRRGTSLNLLIELQCPIAGDEQANEGFANLRLKLADWVQQQKIDGQSLDWCAVWASQDRTGEQGEMGHLMLHCPSRTLESSLRRAVRRWCRARGCIATIKRIEWARSARAKSLHCSVPNFIFDHVIPPELHGQVRVDPAPILRTRCGVSEPLDRLARSRWNAMRRMTADLRRAQGEMRASRDGKPASKEGRLSVAA